MWECDYCRMIEEKRRLRYFGGFMKIEPQHDNSAKYVKVSLVKPKLSTTYQWIDKEKLFKCTCKNDLGMFLDYPDLHLHAFLLRHHRLPTKDELVGRCKIPENTV